MKTLSILAASVLLGSTLIGCAITKFPEFPDVKDHYMVEIRDEAVHPMVAAAIINLDEVPPSQEVARCLHFEIISKNPYKIKFISQVPMKECHLVGGYKPKDSQSIYNWAEDVYRWAETRKKCFK